MAESLQLTREQRLENRALSRRRIVIEHINRRLKIFKILSERYRNRGRRFGLRFNLICNPDVCLDSFWTTRL